MTTRRMIVVLVSVLAVAVIGFLGYVYFQSKGTPPEETAVSEASKESEESEESREVSYIEEENHYQPVIEMENGEALQAAKEINPQVKGWLQVAGIDVYAPVAQAADNEYYRAHDWRGEESEAGAYYFDSGCYVDYMQDLSPNAIIFGRSVETDRENAEDNIQFRQLERYLDAAFFEENKTILLTIGDFEIPYEVIGAGQVDTAADPLLLKANPTPEEFQEVLEIVRRVDVHGTDFQGEGMTNIITLFAYEEGSAEGFAVFGKLALE